MIKERLSDNVLPLQLPIGKEENFIGVVDLVELKAYKWEEEKFGVKIDNIPIPEDMKELVKKYHEKLLEALADVDDSLLEKYLDSHEVDINELKAVIRKATISNAIVPAVCGTALKNKGIQKLLDCVIDYLPSPIDIPAMKGIQPNSGQEITREAKDDAPLAALAFKIMTDPYVGKLTYFRVYSGTLTAGSVVYNTGKDKMERVNRILKMHANKREDVNEVYAGDIAAAVGLKLTQTGDSLCDKKHPIIIRIYGIS